MDLLPLAQAAQEVVLTGTVLRLVQQQGLHTLGPLVDDLEQLARLERLVEASKPFGGRQSMGIFYGSRSRAGSLLEGAYYSFLFWEGMQEAPPTAIRRQQTLFSVLINTSRGLKLQTFPENAALRDPRHYGPTQRLGQWMREAGLEAFEYLSARSSESLVQVGVFTPAAFASTPFDQVDITCEIKPDHVSFLSHDDGAVHHFPRELFLIEGELPQAAA